MYTLLVTGDVPGAATYFNPLLNQTIVPCTSGTRPSSPQNGQHVYETDTTRTMKWNSTLVAWEAVASSRQSFTPTLTAATTNPTMGAGAVRQGWYTYGPGPSVTYGFHVAFGSAPAAGTGNYAISLPVTASSPFTAGNIAIGSILLADASSGIFKIGSTLIGNAATTLGLIVETSIIVGSAAPWVWAQSDYLSGTVTYPI